MAQRKPIVVGFDIDGVLADLTSGMAEIAERDYNIHIPHSAVDKWDFYVDVLGGKGAMFRVMDQAWNELELQPEEPGLARTIARLSRGRYHRMILSARTYSSHKSVIRWIHDQDIRYDTVALVGSGLNKFDYPVDILIDDRPSCVEDVKRYPSKFLYLRDQPWNRDVGDLPDNVERVKSVAEAVERILAREGRREHAQVL